MRAVCGEAQLLESEVGSIYFWLLTGEGGVGERLIFQTLDIIIYNVVQ